MKKFLLSLTLLGAAFLGNAQVVINEIYTDASATGNVQYFELYNAGNTSVDISCYSLVSQYTEGTGNRAKTGFYVIDLPNVTLVEGQYYVGAYAGGPTTSVTSGGVTYTPDFNWNAGVGALEAIGASFRKYERSGASYNYNASTKNNITTPTDFFYTQPGGNVKHNVFLLNRNTVTNQVEYINGFVSYGNSATSTTPSFITGMPALKISSTNCGGEYEINFGSTIPSSEFYEAAGGNSHGYYRGRNALCGTWAKLTLSTNDYATPETINPIGTITTLGSGGITSNQVVLCDKTQVKFGISAVADPSVFPITVELYYDKGSVGNYDVLDEIQASATQTINADQIPYSGTFTIPADQPVLLIYRTALGCISAITRPSTAANFVTKQYNICNKQAAFSITNADANTLSYGFPVTAQYLYNGQALGEPITITKEQLGTNVYYSPIPVGDLTYNPANLSIRYTPSNCLSPTTVTGFFNPSIFTIVTGSLTTSETVVSVAAPAEDLVDVTVDITKIVSSIEPQTTSVFPVEVRLYIDNKPDNSLPDTAANVDNTSYLGSLYFNNIEEASKSFSDEDEVVLKRAFTSADYGKDLYIVYQTNLACFTTVVIREIPNPAPLPVTYTSFTATRTNNSQVVLEWKTATEENNKGFHVQRNVDGTWKDVAFVISKADRGNSTSSLKYNYKDANSHRGISQYRILQVDIDGKGKYSEVRSVRGEEMAARLVVFPNPSPNGSFNVLFEDATSLRDVIVSDVSGRTIKQYKGVSNGSLSIDNLGAGFYTVQVLNRTTGAIATEKVIIKKR